MVDSYFRALLRAGLMIVFFATPSQSRAQAVSELKGCGPPDYYKNYESPSLAACTAAIDSGRYKGRNLAIIYSRRGVAYHDHLDDDLALIDFNEATRIDPKYADPYLWRGIIYRLKPDYERALAELNQAIRLEQNARAYRQRALIYDARKDYNRAVADLTNAIRLSPDDDTLLVYRGEIYLLKHEYNRAIADFNRAFRMLPLGIDANLHLRGIAYYLAKKYDLAIADFERLMELKKVDALYGRGVAKLRKGDIAGGVADIAEAKKNDDQVSPDFERYGIKPEER